MVSDEVKQLFIKATTAKAKFKLGYITRTEAKMMIDPYIKKFNEVSKEKASKYNVKPKLISFSNFVR